MKITRSQLKKIIQEEFEGVTKELKIFSPSPLQEKAPPGKKALVKDLKKEMCGGKDDCPEAFATAWKQHNKGK